MARRLAAQLAEALQLIERQVVAGQMQQAVEQHGAVAGGKDEAVAIEPARILGIVLEEPRPQRESHGGCAHRHAGVPRVRILHRVRGKNADGVDAQIVERGSSGQGMIPFVRNFILRRSGGQAMLLDLATLN
jgi:hypothetical protein